MPKHKKEDGEKNLGKNKHLVRMSNDTEKNHDHLGKIAQWDGDLSRRNWLSEGTIVGKLISDEISVVAGWDGEFLDRARH